MSRGHLPSTRKVNAPGQATSTSLISGPLRSDLFPLLIGYHTRRATNRILDLFHQQMDGRGIKPSEFAVLHIIGQNPGVTPGQLCTELDLLPPNLAKIVGRFIRRHLVDRKVSAIDKRIATLRLTPAGEGVLREAEGVVVALERQASSRLTDPQRAELVRLLRKIYE